MLNPTTLPTSVPTYSQNNKPNYFAALSMDGDDDITVAMSNCADRAKSNEGTAATETLNDDDSLSDNDKPNQHYPVHITGIPACIPMRTRAEA